MKQQGDKIVMLTAYDYTSARIIESAGIALILVGDSLAQVMLGYNSTLPVTTNEMIHHVKSVVRGTQKAHIVGDMPFMSYQSNVADAIHNAGRILQEGGAQSVKLEGGRHMADTVHHLVAAGIPVMGHIGLTPQSVNQIGGYFVQGKSIGSSINLIEDAITLEKAGAYSIVLESVPTHLAGFITDTLSIPTIGIGAGVRCDGQVQVLHDILGLFEEFVPRHSRRYTNIAKSVKTAVAQYIRDTQSETFPTADESFPMDPEVLESLVTDL